MADNVVFEDFSIRVKKVIENAAIAGLYEAASELESQVKQNSRRDTSKTMGSFKHYVDDSALTAFIGSDSINSLYEEFGTGEYALEGKGRKGAWYVPADKVTGRKKPAYFGQVIVIEKNGKKFYKTNGKKPTKAFQLAYKYKKNALIRIIENKMRGI